MNNKSFLAFIVRGIDSKIATDLIEKNITLAKLKYLNVDKLLTLGISRKVAEEIEKEVRPPIPTKTAIKLLYDSKRTCCVCRASYKPIIIHHIEEWNESRSHDETNLVVLCLEDHDLAHTKKGLSIALSKQQLKEFKKNWINDVVTKDALAILGLVNRDYSRWDYFNHNRIFELFFQNKIEYESFKTFETCYQLGLINDLGVIVNLNLKKNQFYFYDFGDGYMLSYYMKELFESLLKHLPIIDLTDKFNKEDVLSLISPGKFIALQAGFYFKDLTKKQHGKNQMRKGYYQKGNIKIEFVIDAAECTSCSAWGDHIRRHSLVTPICYVKGLRVEEQKLIIDTSCLAIGSYFEDSEFRKNRHNNYS